MTDIKVHLADMIHKSQLSEHPQNSNKQSRHTFKELRKSIRENGFDEVLTVAPRSDGTDGYWIVSGNHRYKAGVAEGMKEFPCIVRDDWDEVQQQIELVRRNYVRGQIDKHAFTVAVDTLAKEKQIAIDDVRDMMGFEDPDIFLNYYNEEQEQIERAKEQVQRTSAPAVRMLDDMQDVLTSILENYGDTVPSSFLIFPAGGKKHMFVSATPAIVKVMQELAEYAISEHLDINMVLGGVLAIGKHHSHLSKPEFKKEEVLEAEAEIEGDPEFT